MDVNKWFLSLPPERQAVLREDKWMLANAAAQAAEAAEREAASMICDEVAKDWNNFDDVTAYKIKRLVNERSNT